MPKILLVEDNKMIVKGLSYTLEQNSFEVEVAYNYKDSIKSINTKYFDLIILDISLPDGNGFDLCQYVNDKTKTPVIFLTAKDDEETIVNGLKLGAEDYIIKPFRTGELLLRIEKILKRSNNKVININNVTVDIDKCVVYVDNEEVNLTSLEFKILSLLFINKNKVVSREVILDKIWDMAGNFVNDNTLSVYIKRIRAKLNNEDIIKTIKGIGYRVDE